jgi:hypothetical protein
MPSCKFKAVLEHLGQNGGDGSVMLSGHIVAFPRHCRGNAYLALSSMRSSFIMSLERELANREVGQGRVYGRRERGKKER